VVVDVGRQEGVPLPKAAAPHPTLQLCCNPATMLQLCMATHILSMHIRICLWPDKSYRSYISAGSAGFGSSRGPCCIATCKASHTSYIWNALYTSHASYISNAQYIFGVGWIWILALLTPTVRKPPLSVSPLASLPPPSCVLFFEPQDPSPSSTRPPSPEEVSPRDASTPRPLSPPATVAAGGGCGGGDGGGGGAGRTLHGTVRLELQRSFIPGAPRPGAKQKTVTGVGRRGNGGRRRRRWWRCRGGWCVVLLK